MAKPICGVWCSGPNLSKTCVLTCALDRGHSGAHKCASGHSFVLIKCHICRGTGVVGGSPCQTCRGDGLIGN